MAKEVKVYLVEDKNDPNVPFVFYNEDEVIDFANENDESDGSRVMVVTFKPTKKISIGKTSLVSL